MPTCDVVGCEREAVRAVSREDARKVFRLKEGRGKAHLCREHYKEFKKKTKKERKLRYLAWRG